MTESQSLHVVAAVTLQDGKLQQATEILQNLTEQVKKSEPDVAKYYAFQTKNDKGQDQVVFVEKYANAAALENHRAQAHYQLFQSQAREIVAGPPDIKVGQFLSGFEARSNL